MTDEEKIFTVRFEHPFVGSKGSAIYFTTRANTFYEAILKAKVNRVFMKEVNQYATGDHPILDNYFTAYEDPSGNIGKIKHFEGDERL